MSVADLIAERDRLRAIGAALASAYVGEAPKRTAAPKPAATPKARTKTTKPVRRTTPAADLTVAQARAAYYGELRRLNMRNREYR